MKKIFMLVVAIAGISMGAHAQLLWKISGKNLEKPSYVFGTHHVAPLSIVDSIPEMGTVISATEQVYGEIDMLSMQSSMQQMAMAMMLPSDTTLLDLLGEKVYAKVDSVMTRYRLGSLDNPAMRRMKPAALSSLLAVAMSRAVLPEFGSTQLDAYFQLQAREAGKPVGGLETAQQQIKILYGAPLRRQAEQLACVVENADWNVALMKSLGDAYMRQDLDALEELMSQKLGGACDSTPEEDEMLVGGRNDAWMEQMPKIMEAHSTLFVVGVGHLVGERGLLRQLQKCGYQVEGIR
ncbi:MAG TPA: TraB/GumN family protein [Candidatus Limisoma intestinavium]|uniref:TraB/GumN family protein n=1 Tax=Candidatus Limisoma intestinavium TaxID=2840856 RepID=A0A9D1IMS6_9BACT|nr:TraB/GumN family protein [Candidatus Limisoma intestinavium]